MLFQPTHSHSEIDLALEKFLYQRTWFLDGGTRSTITSKALFRGNKSKANLPYLYQSSFYSFFIAKLQKKDFRL